MGELYTEQQLREWKLSFAETYLAKPNDALMIVRRLLPGDPNPFDIIRFAEQWPSDPLVKEEMNRLIAIPPDRNKITLEVLALARDSKQRMQDRIAAYKVAADMQSWNSSTTSAKAKVMAGDRLGELAAMISDD